MTAFVSYLKGQQASASAMNKANSTLSIPGMAAPAKFNPIAPSTLYVTTHSGMFGNGVTLYEPNTISLNTDLFFQRGAAAFNGSLVYRIDPQLYTKPLLRIEPGFVLQDSDPNILVLGWVLYPGSSAALSANQFIAAQPADLFRYTYFATARDIFNAFSVSSVPDTLDKWYAAVNAGSGSPTYATYLLQNGTSNSSTSPLVSVQSINGEYFTCIKNLVGQPTQNIVLELIGNNYDNKATSLHTRLFMDAGASITTGIQFRGLSSEMMLDTGTVTGGVSIGVSPGTFVFSLSTQYMSLVKESVVIRYHLNLPAGKTIGFASAGLGNQVLFEQVYTAD